MNKLSKHISDMRLRDDLKAGVLCLGQRILLDSSRDLGPRFGFEDRRCQDVQIFLRFLGGGSATPDPVADLFHRPTQQHPAGSAQ